MEDKPFYLKGTGNNLITEDKIVEFLNLNPELREKILQYDIELKTLDLSHFESFIAWILSQQISGKVAETLFDRFKILVGSVTPKKVLEISVSKYREIGLSRSKIEYIKNLANFYHQGIQLDDHHKYSSDEILEHYTQIKGIGPWTVNMFLIFNLGRLDISAPKDLVVRKGLKELYDLNIVPDEKSARNLMRKWGEYGTIGTILCWAAMGE